MMLLTWTLVVIFAISRPSSVCTQGKFESTTIKQYPYHVGIEDYDMGLMGSGAILTEKHVITSAYTVDCPACDFLVRAGSSHADYFGDDNVVEEEGTESMLILVGSIYIHPNYQRGNRDFPRKHLEYDIAVVTLRKYLKFSDAIRPVKMPDCSVETTPEGALGFLTGWGSPGPLTETEQPVWNNSDCGAVITDKKATTDRIFCVGRPRGEEGECHTLDFGSPFVIDGHLYGVSSMFEECYGDGTPAQLESVPAFRSFIDEKVCTRTVREDPNRICTSKSLKGMRLNVPRAVRVGHSVTLGCEYDLEDAPLYSVKWYRNNDEFYRYVPKEEPPTRVFPLPGLHVDVSVSNAHNVTLLSVGRPMSGVFQCEVSADAPRFHTEMMSAPMTVSVVPDGVPTVIVDRAGLEHGGPLIADCLSPPSFPAPNLTWYVNDQRVPGSTSSSIITDAVDHLDTARSRLELTGVGGSWGAIRLRCEASLFRLYRVNSLEVEVRPDTPQPASVLLKEGHINKGEARGGRHPSALTLLCLSTLLPLIVGIFASHHFHHHLRLS